MSARRTLLRRLQRDIPAPPVDEVRLLHDVRHGSPELAWPDLTCELLNDLTREHGVDFATALLYDRIRRSDQHGRFIAELESFEFDLERLPRLQGTVLIVPAPFYRELPEFGGDGRLVAQVAAAFGLRTVVAPVPSVGSVTCAAAVVRQAIRAQAEPLVIVSMSKGSADVRMALEENGSPPHVRAWLQVCGLVRGTPLVNLSLSGSWPRRKALDGFLRLAGGRLDDLSELAHGPGTLLHAPFIAPEGLLVVNVVGFPLGVHLSGNARARHTPLAEVGGPNDGSTLLLDAIVEPGLVYPVWAADHYFRVPRAAEVVYRVFLYLASVGRLCGTR